MTTSPLVRPDDVAAARKLLRGIVSPTPMLHSRVLSERLRGPVFLKCENLQRTGSFKARGAYVRISRLTEAERNRGVVAGQGTLGLEIMEQCPEARTIVVPVGGGGLASGITVAVSDADPPVRVVGVQAEAVAPFPASLAAGHPVRIEPGATMADGIAVATPGEICCEILGRLGVTVLTVAEETLSTALLLCLERAKQLVEPAGAAAVAAMLEHQEAIETPAVAVLSGGNIDPLLLSKVLRHGLAAAKRYLIFRCELPDRPGALSRLLAEVAALGANVLDISHERIAPRLLVDEAEVLLQVETRGASHRDAVIAGLRRAGYTLKFI